MALELATRVSGEVTIVDLRGRCTLGDETEDLGRELKKLIDGGCRKLLLNLTGLSQIDSTGVSTIVASYVTLRRLKGEVKLLHPTGRVQTVLEITHMLQVIPNFEEEAAAVASFSTRTYTATQ
ncbi:MAG TPA: STAS domain-containing protein [Candidatus Acidoferrum sp.]|jgi:anti-sigma B factor antagonist